MNKLSLSAASLVSLVVMAASSNVAMAKGGEDNPAVVIIDQTGSSNNVDANITNDSSNPVPITGEVTVVNDGTETIRVSNGSHYQFKGYGARTLPNIGLIDMNNICSEEFGESARMCTTVEYFETPSNSRTAGANEYWILPVLRTSFYDMRREEPAFVEAYGGRYNTWQNATCLNYTSDSEDRRGVIVDFDGADGQGILSDSRCDRDYGVACCTPQ